MKNISKRILLVLAFHGLVINFYLLYCINDPIRGKVLNKVRLGYARRCWEPLISTSPDGRRTKNFCPEINEGPPESFARDSPESRWKELFS